MRAYCKILNEETGLVQKGEGCSNEYYQEIGMEIRDIQQSDIDGEWYLTEKCPMKPEPTAADRREAFLKDFFKVDGYGYYRKTPKGYKSAVESINTAYAMCKENNGLPAGIIIFYQEPDFNKPEQCTEQWLINHQIVLPAMDVQTFVSLFNLFITTWNRQEH